MKRILKKDYCRIFFKVLFKMKKGVIKMINSHLNKNKGINDYPRKIRPSDIAIVGISCRFPQANDYQRFWKNLKNGIDSITEIPESRWDTRKYYSPDPGKKNKSLSKWGGLINSERDFDHFFRRSN